MDRPRSPAPHQPPRAPLNARRSTTQPPDSSPRNDLRGRGLGSRWHRVRPSWSRRQTREGRPRSLESPPHRGFPRGIGGETGEGEVLVDVEEVRTIGQRLREIRYWRGKSLRVVAELAGISESYLSRLERSERQVDRRLPAGGARRRVRGRPRGADRGSRGRPPRAWARHTPR